MSDIVNKIKSFAFDGVGLEALAISDALAKKNISEGQAVLQGRKFISALPKLYNAPDWIKISSVAALGVVILSKRSRPVDLRQAKDIEIAVRKFIKSRNECVPRLKNLNLFSFSDDEVLGGFHRLFALALQSDRESFEIFAMKVKK